MKKKIFFISPVQTATPENFTACGKYVEKLEKEGCKVHWHIRATDQNDPIGINICDANLRKIREADEIHIWYLKESSGIHFDIGAVYMLTRILGFKKKIVFVNKNDFADDIGEHKGKSFARVLDFLDKNT